MDNKEFEKLVKEAVRCYANERRLEGEPLLSVEDVYIVWSCKTLQNNKALVSTTRSDGMYYELTYNGDKDELYFDAYRKLENRCIKSPIERVLILGGGVSAVATASRPVQEGKLIADEKNTHCVEITLKDTVPLMLSADYKDRFEAEYLQLQIRRDKLAAMVEKYAAGTLDFAPTCSLELLRDQLEAMDKYMDILWVRSTLEKVRL